MPKLRIAAKFSSISMSLVVGTTFACGEVQPAAALTAFAALDQWKRVCRNHGQTPVRRRNIGKITKDEIKTKMKEQCAVCCSVNRVRLITHV